MGPQLSDQVDQHDAMDVGSSVTSIVSSKINEGGDSIRVWPLLGGADAERTGCGSCVLLEMCGIRILLDCGAPDPIDFEILEELAAAFGAPTTTNKTSYENSPRYQAWKNAAAGGKIDAILLSHGDIAHCGGLPVLCGESGLGEIPIFCTSPVYSFAQVTLYDYFLSAEMEGESRISPTSGVNGEENMKAAGTVGDNGAALCRGPSGKTYTFDDIDTAFDAVTTVKYNQTMTVHSRSTGLNSQPGKRNPIVTVTALAAGRTVGGSTWKIRCGSTEVVYAMDGNLRRETVLPGAPLDYLPTSPALLITDGTLLSSQKQIDEEQRMNSATQQRRGTAWSSLCTDILETVRNGGNVLLPSETAGRTLELLQLLDRYWTDHKLAMYHLIFLSPMARNVVEYARCQLEWMSDTITKPFYSGKPNPFDLPSVRLVTSLLGLERQYPGPKVVVSTCGSLSLGVSKELLLKWGGDPRCRVIFTDLCDEHSLAAELLRLARTSAVITNVARPLRVELTGADLVAFQQEQELKRRLREEEVQRLRREEELSMLKAGGDGDNVEEEDSDADDADHTEGEGHEEMERKRPRQNGSALRFVQQNFVRFEHRETLYRADDYGIANDDIPLCDIASSESRITGREKAGQAAAAVHAGEGRSKIISGSSGGVAENENEGTLAERGAIKTVGGTGGTGRGGVGKVGTVGMGSNGVSGGATVPNSGLINLADQPWKLVSTVQRIQFTCDFRRHYLGGRNDAKGLRALIQRVAPQRLMILHCSPDLCDPLFQTVRSSVTETFCPSMGVETHFSIRAEKLMVQIPRTMVPGNLKTIRAAGSTSLAVNSLDSGNVSSCTVCVLRGTLSAVELAGEDGTRFFRYQGNNTEESDHTAVEHPTEEAEAAEISEDLEDLEAEVESQPLEIVDETLGTVSMGEVTLSALKTALEATGLKSEFLIDGSGGVLVVADQVIVRRDEADNFSVEGPPVQAFFAVRQALYQQCSFV